MLQLEEQCKLIYKIFKGTDPFLIAQTNAKIATPRTAELLILITQNTPLTTPSLNEISKLESKLHERRTEVIVVKSFMSERFSLIK